MIEILSNYFLCLALQQNRFKGKNNRYNVSLKAAQPFEEAFIAYSKFAFAYA